MNESTEAELLRQAMTHHAAGEFAAADALYRQILARNPDQIDGLHLRGVLAHQTGHQDVAETLIRRALALNPAFAAAHDNLGNALREQGRFADAAASHARATALNPAAAEPHNNLANALVDLGRLEESIASYRAALALRPDYAVAHTNLGIALYRLGRLDEAAASHRQALALDPANPAALIQLGVTLYAGKQWTEAEACYRQAIARQPDAADAHNNLGALLQARGDHAGALACYRQAEAIRPGDGLARLNQGAVLIRLRRQAEAVSVLTTLIELPSPHRMEALRSLVSTLVELDRGGDALAAVDAVAAEQPDDPEIGFIRALALAPDRMPEAVAAVEQALARLCSATDRFQLVADCALFLWSAGRRLPGRLAGQLADAALTHLAANRRDVAAWKALNHVTRAGVMPTARIGATLTGWADAGELPERLLAAGLLADLDGDWNAVATVIALARHGDSAVRQAVLAYAYATAVFDSTGSADLRARLERAGFSLLLAELTAGLASCAPAPRPAVGPVRRVAIVTAELRGIRQAPTMLTLSHARLLTANGIEARVFCTNEYVSVAAESSLAARHGFQPVDLQLRDEWALLFDGGIFVSTEPDLTRKCRETVAAIEAFAPDAVLFVGIYSVVAELLYRAYPVVALATHAILPPASMDLLLDQGDLPIRPGWPGLAAPAGRIGYTNRIAPLPERGIGRQALGLPEGAFVLVTAGLRLAYEMTPDWTRMVLDFMARRDDVWWLLVGGTAFPHPELPGPRDRVRCMAPTDNLAGVYRQCDVALNPPRTGGGFSVAFGMSAGLPTLSFGGADGGNKVGEDWIVAPDDYQARLEALYADAAYRRHFGQAMRRRFDEELSIGGGLPRLRQALDQAVAAYRIRAAS